ncbi:3-methyl-2-oxobutanoate hydroxymethyltransferase [Kangiella spongicola]|uniref:3-methyl-2-oxobutanoate hydroxymethyltransferase n=1 Tax=Kangiella spongicola TaxID=796379 RepID=A0A318D6Y1_9GAMM|nr:3-methyl-2-oxobutanoate hydroxymethyltransferase [Kangiella spongicola]MBV35305.1 3-methyl-2-oxobutanoate hydroxymethyltransferase [Rickettsiales bacterium]PXF64573.1 3-methyl-2-oxobutanoate hydroxymethyltransferase [Kangiella spongicola]
MKYTSISHIEKLKANGEKFSCLTAYDATFAGVMSEVGIDMILVGDSLGNVIQGQKTTVPVTLEQMEYHIDCVSRGNQNCLIAGDMPYMSYSTPEEAYDTARRIMQAGAQMVKLEGGAWLLDTIQGLTVRGIPVCAHLGLTPQSVDALGGFKVQGRDQDTAEILLDDAKKLEAAGARMLVLECVPSELAKKVAEELVIPVMGIGAGVDVDGQVLVLHDMLGISPFQAKFVRNFMADANGDIKAAIELYHQEVKAKNFPAPQHSFD